MIYAVIDTNVFVSALLSHHADFSVEHHTRGYGNVLL